MGILCTWVKLLTNSAHRIAQKCVWRPRSARTRWGAIALPRPFLYFVSCRRYTFIPRYTTIIGRISRCKIKSSVTSRAAECPCPSSHLTVDIDRSADNKRHKSPASRRSEVPVDMANPRTPILALVCRPPGSVANHTDSCRDFVGITSYTQGIRATSK